jgi:hypothetical protein
VSALSRSFAHAQARIQARYAVLPAEADWRRLSGSRGLGAWLEDARRGPLRDWVKGFSAASTAQDIEAGVRERLLEEIDAVANFVPERWREAVSWTRWLPLLILFEHLSAGGALPDWARRVPSLAALLDEDGGWLERRVAAADIVRLLDTDAEAPPATAWLDGWRRRWPHPSAAARADLDAFAAELARHLEAFRQSRLENAWTLRQQLRERLRAAFHGLGLSPAAPFVYLALVALDLERLRRALLDRALFSAWPAPAVASAACAAQAA